MFKIAFASALLVITSSMLAQTRNTDAGNPELDRIQSEYSDVLALQGTARPSCSQSPAYSERTPRWRSIAQKQRVSTVSRAARALWFTTHRSPSPQRKTWSTSSMPHSYSQLALTPSECQGFQLWARWNPANGTSFRVGSSILTISMTSLRQRSLLPLT